MISVVVTELLAIKEVVFRRQTTWLSAMLPCTSVNKLAESVEQSVVAEVVMAYWPPVTEIVNGPFIPSTVWGSENTKIFVG